MRPAPSRPRTRRLLARLHGNYHVLYGHDSSNTDPYRPEDISEAQAIKNGMARPLTIKRTDTFAYMDTGDAGMVSATMLQGFRSSTPKGQYYSMSKPEALAKFGKVETSTYRTLYAVVYTNDHEQPKSVGYALEPIPQFNPSKAKKGDSVPVQVLFKGKPLANAIIKDNHLSPTSQKIKTDVQGKANLIVANDGHNAWSVRHNLHYHDVRLADTAQYGFVLTFFAHTPGQGYH